MLEIKDYVRSDFNWAPWLFPGISQPQRDAKQSSLSIVEAETKWSFTSTSLRYLNAMNEAHLPLHQFGTDRQESLTVYAIGPN